MAPSPKAAPPLKSGRPTGRPLAVRARRPAWRHLGALRVLLPEESELHRGTKGVSVPITESTHMDHDKNISPVAGRSPPRAPNEGINRIPSSTGATYRRRGKAEAQWELTERRYKILHCARTADAQGFARSISAGRHPLTAPREGRHVLDVTGPQHLLRRRDHILTERPPVRRPASLRMVDAVAGPQNGAGKSTTTLKPDPRVQCMARAPPLRPRHPYKGEDNQRGAAKPHVHVCRLGIR